jgi:hypothetical protein
MAGSELLREYFTAGEWKLWRDLTSPLKIQNYLDQLAYSSEDVYRCPFRVVREKRAHCFDGAIFAAATLRRLGYPPIILELIPNRRDDDHLLAIFKNGGCWGAVGKSNFVGLRYREPVYRTLRELVMSYFESYYNVAGERTLRGYTQPLNLRIFDPFNWIADDAALDRIALRLDQIRRNFVLESAKASKLSRVDPRSFRAGLLGADERGLFRPKGKMRKFPIKNP